MMGAETSPTVPTVAARDCSARKWRDGKNLEVLSGVMIRLELEGAGRAFKSPCSMSRGAEDCQLLSGTLNLPAATGLCIELQDGGARGPQQPEQLWIAICPLEQLKAQGGWQLLCCIKELMVTCPQNQAHPVTHPNQPLALQAQLMRSRCHGECR
eukprot:CAMPEP_0172760722 /NCGR_PEP_ID=MMETSP1074-20121228/170174_1 /TAXON_ID=2916 /ORGANISM="Ceratium fusus, Strain PA161109" /LENGTH=154 /DNA_ID=CAMNT_0013594773 /DNA_START=81 /DNA_END=542 /DNA_ORIENTATION=-